MRDAMMPSGPADAIPTRSSPTAASLGTPNRCVSAQTSNGIATTSRTISFASTLMLRSGARKLAKSDDSPSPSPVI
jgi:hypothetical protein